MNESRCSNFHSKNGFNKLIREVFCKPTMPALQEFQSNPSVSSFCCKDMAMDTKYFYIYFSLLILIKETLLVVESHFSSCPSFLAPFYFIVLRHNTAFTSFLGRCSANLKYLLYNNSSQTHPFLAFVLKT